MGLEKNNLRYLLPVPPFPLPTSPKRPKWTQIPLPLPSKFCLHPIPPLPQPRNIIANNPCAEKKNTKEGKNERHE